MKVLNNREEDGGFWLPNIQRMKAVINGTTRTVRACTRCIRTGVIVRPVKRNYKPEAAQSTG